MTDVRREGTVAGGGDANAGPRPATRARKRREGDFTRSESVEGGTEVLFHYSMRPYSGLYDEPRTPRSAATRHYRACFEHSNLFKVNVPARPRRTRHVARAKRRRGADADNILTAVAFPPRRVRDAYGRARGGARLLDALPTNARAGANATDGDDACPPAGRTSR